MGIETVGDDLTAILFLEMLEKVRVIYERTSNVEEFMTEANDALVALKAQLADTTSDILAKLDQFQQQVGRLPEDAAATLNEIVAGVQSLDDTVGDADESETPVP